MSNVLWQKEAISELYLNLPFFLVANAKPKSANKPWFYKGLYF
jgi:hypothetical protein